MLATGGGTLFIPEFGTLCHSRRHLKHYGTTDRIQKVSVWQQLIIARAVEIGLGVSGLSQIDLKSANVPEIESIRTQMI